MLTDISHEIKTPVSVIRAGSETLNSGALNDIGTAKKFTKSIQENAERLSEMIDDLLELEKIEFSGIALHSGLNVNISIRPADVNFGIVFKRVDIKENNLVCPNFMNVTNTSLNTTEIGRAHV